VIEKLESEPVEDFRIDFEDGYGNRPDDEEDGHAVAAAAETAEGSKKGTLPPFIGIRIKPFNEELRARSFRTLDIFVSTLAEPFLRGAKRIRTDHTGVGLGLAIVKSITEAHDGTLTLTPRPGGGLRATVELRSGQ